MQDSVILETRKAERIVYEGLVGVRTHLDESKQIIWINLNDLIDDIGIPIHDELNWLNSDGGEVFAKNIGLTIQRVISDLGEVGECLYIPHYSINDYLYNRPMENLAPDVASNLHSYRRGFAIEVDRFWKEFSKTIASVDTFDISRLLWIRAVERIEKVMAELNYRGVFNADHAVKRIQQFVYVMLGRRVVVPTSELSEREMDALRLLNGVYIDQVIRRLHRGEDPSQVLHQTEESMVKYMGDVFRLLK